MYIVNANMYAITESGEEIHFSFYTSRLGTHITIHTNLKNPASRDETEKFINKLTEFCRKG